MIAYVSYDGVLEPLGQSQVLPYVLGLAERGLPPVLLSFEKPGDFRSGQARRLRTTLAARGVRWIPRRYHKRPTLPATAWDVAVGIATLGALRARRGLRAVHARSYVAALMAWTLQRALGTGFIFDMRGFWPEERVDGGLWSSDSRVYRLVKALERRFLRDADHIVVLTERAREDLLGRRGVKCPVTVIPTCVDLDRFQPAASRAGGGLTFVYAGSIGTVYPLEAMLAFYKRARERHPAAQLRLVNRGGEKELARALEAGGLDDGSVSRDGADYGAVPEQLRTATAGLAFYRPGYSRRATCPTKVGEYLACGLPVVITAGVGDMDRIVTDSRVGVVVEALSEPAYDSALYELEKLLVEPDLAARCRAVAERHFSLAVGIERFGAIHRSLAEPSLESRR